MCLLRHLSAFHFLLLLLLLYLGGHRIRYESVPQVLRNDGSNDAGYLFVSLNLGEDWLQVNSLYLPVGFILNLESIGALDQCL